MAALGEGGPIMARSERGFRSSVPTIAALLLAVAATAPARAAGVTSQEVERAIKDGVRFLQSNQAPNGGWPGQNGTTSLVTLALLTAGESPDSPPIARALRGLASVGADQI